MTLIPTTSPEFDAFTARGHGRQTTSIETDIAWAEHAHEADTFAAAWGGEFPAMTTTLKPQLCARRISVSYMETITIAAGPGTDTAVTDSIGCDDYDVVRLRNGTDLYVDAAGSSNGSPLNVLLTIAAHALGTPTVLYGNAIALGRDPETGNTISLTNEQIHQLNAAVATKPKPETIDRLAVSLHRFPGILDTLRNL